MILCKSSSTYIPTKSLFPKDSSLLQLIKQSRLIEQNNESVKIKLRFEKKTPYLLLPKTQVTAVL